MLTQDDVQRLAMLARLELSEEELEQQVRELEKILGYVGRLSAVDTSGVPETEDAEGGSVVRPDVEASSDDACREIILSDFPDRLGDALRVPAVFEKPKGGKNGV